MNMKALKGEELTGTDAEACAYLYTACLTQPVDSDWTQIYLYVANQVYSRHRTEGSGVQFPEDIHVESLSDYQMAELHRLKDWIYERRTQAKQERERTERQKKREEEATSKSMERPALFEF
jgi:membrane protein involved in colicin uptake